MAQGAQAMSAQAMSAQTWDGSVISPHGQLMQAMHAETRYDLSMKEAKAEEAQARLLPTRRARILPSEEDLQRR